MVNDNENKAKNEKQITQIRHKQTEPGHGYRLNVKCFS